MSASQLTAEKGYPTNYPADAVTILDAMSFTDGKAIKLRGTMGLRSQQYAGDYDGFETVTLNEPNDAAALNILAAKFQTIIKRLRGMKTVYIGDVKSGVVPEWRVLPTTATVVDGAVRGYDAATSRGKVAELLRAGIISPGEAKRASGLLKDTPTPTELLTAKGELKFHVVRWNVEEILAGQKRLRGGRTFTLQDAFSSPGITKLDTIGLIANNRYTDFSVISTFVNKGRTLNPEPINLEQSLLENIIFYRATGQPFKALKREFSLARAKGDETEIVKLSGILNSDLGRLYLVSSDIGTLITLLEDHTSVPMDKVRFEIDQFKGRLSNIYETEEYLKNEHDLLGDLNAAVKIAQPKALAQRLHLINGRLLSYLKAATNHRLTGSGSAAAGDPKYEPLVDTSALLIASQNPARYEQYRTLELMLRDLAHRSRYTSPVASLGYRVMADDLSIQQPVVAPRPGRPAATQGQDINSGHATYRRLQAVNIINGTDAPIYATRAQFNAQRSHTKAAENLLQRSNPKLPGISAQHNTEFGARKQPYQLRQGAQDVTPIYALFDLIRSTPEGQTWLAANPGLTRKEGDDRMVERMPWLG